MGSEVDWFYRDNRELASCAELVGLFGGCICGWRHRQTVASGLFSPFIICVMILLYFAMQRRGQYVAKTGITRSFYIVLAYNFTIWTFLMKCL